MGVSWDFRLIVEMLEWVEGVELYVGTGVLRAVHLGLRGEGDAG